MSIDKIAVRGGHNRGVPGAVGIIDEVTEDRHYYPAVIKYLKMAGKQVLDVTPPGPTATSAADLEYGVNMANNWGADLFVSCHINASGGTGCEVLYSLGSAKGQIYAEQVDNAIAKLGFHERGAKYDVRGLYEIKYTHMPAIIVEPFFLDQLSDVNIYRNMGYDLLGKTIAEGILGCSITVPASTPAAPVTPTSADRAGVVKTGVLRVRSSSAIADNVIGRLSQGTKVRIAGKDGGWYHIYYGNEMGWVSADYIGLIPITKTVTASSLHVRGSVGIADNIIGSLAHGALVKVGWVENGWANIYYGSSGGFVSAQYLN